MQPKLTVSQVKATIECLEKYFSEYKNKDAIISLNEIQKKLDAKEYKIAVVANMSSGKSTFINALFGREVLPAFNHATTDSATYIYSKPNIEKKAEIFFSNDRSSVVVTDDLESEIKQYAQKDEDCKDEKYKNVEKIELYYPFKNLQTSSVEDFNITFIDTPGPNSTGDYASKHKDQTRSVLNKVDMALFAFDYGQLDANLKSDEQGLWHTIKARNDKDPNFEVYFLINKIDMAMEDNFKDVKNKEEAAKEWGGHEKKAVNKLVAAAQNYGIAEPEVYTVSSKFALLDRNDVSWDSPLDGFKNKFKKVFEDKWEEEYIKYLGITSLEQNINEYINSSVKQKILKIAIDNVSNIKNSELIRLNSIVQTLSKPKEEAAKNISNALFFLNNDAKNLENNLNDRLKTLSEGAIKTIENCIDNSVDKELRSKVDEMSKKIIAYAQSIALDNKHSAATKRAEENYNKIKLDKLVTMELRNNINTKDLLAHMQTYTKSLFEDYRRNYLDIRSELLDSFGAYERDMAKEYRTVQDKLNRELQDALDVEIESLEMQQITIYSNLSFDVSVPDSVLDYKYQNAEYRTVSDSTWYKPWTWGDTRQVKVQDEKHTLQINPLDLKKTIEQSVSISIDSFIDQEKRVYKDAILELKTKNSDIFSGFRRSKQKEIDRLEMDLKESERHLELAEKQLQNFNNLIIEE